MYVWLIHHHIWIRHVVHINESCPICECAKWHPMMCAERLPMSHITREWVMSHAWISHVASYDVYRKSPDESCHTEFLPTSPRPTLCGVATISRLLKIIGLICKRTLYKRLYSTKKTCNFKQPTNRSHPIVVRKRLAKDFQKRRVATELQQSCNRVATELQETCQRLAKDLQKTREGWQISSVSVVLSNSVLNHRT